MRVDLADDPAVIAMAAQLSVGEHTIVGALHKFWSWADKHTVDGNAKGVTFSWINRYIMLPDFAEAMLSTGWLAQNDTGICIPNFDKHNGESGKKRAETNARVAKHRNAKSVTKALPEKRREDIKALPPPIKSASTSKPPHWTTTDQGIFAKATELGLETEGKSPVILRIEIESELTARQHGHH